MKRPPIWPGASKKGRAAERRRLTNRALDKIPADPQPLPKVVPGTYPGGMGAFDSGDSEGKGTVLFGDYEELDSRQQ